MVMREERKCDECGIEISEGNGFLKNGSTWTHDSRVDCVGALKARLATAQSPVNLLLFCPQCGEQHIDEAKPDVCETCGGSEDQFPRDPETFVCVCKVFIAWLNPPHKSHRCTSCNHVWRPADVPTNGVKEIKTNGERDGDTRPRQKELVEALEKLISYNEDIRDGKINYRPDDHIALARQALANTNKEKETRR
jgi:hypothetical protein